MSANTSNSKRCTSGTPSSTRAQSLGPSNKLTSLSRSKTCGFTVKTTIKSKAERLQPIVANKAPACTDDTILDDVNGLHPAMINELCLHSRGLSTIPNLAQFTKLQMLDLSCNHLTRIETLKHLSNLRELKLYGNRIDRIENLECLTQLQTLQLQFNEILTIGAGLTGLTRLQSLRIDSNKLSSIQSDELLKLVQLKLIDVSDNALGNLHFMNTLPSLTELRACHCFLKSLPNPCRNLRYLIDLDLSNNQLTHISPLKNLPSLRILHLANNQIQDIQVLCVLVHLNELDLDHNHVVSLPTAFEKLIDLQYLNVAHNQIRSWSDIDAIRQISSLFILNIHGNPFLSQAENYVQTLLELCPSLEIIDDVSLNDDQSKLMPTESEQQFLSIDQELKDIDRTLEKSIADAQAQFDLILNDLRQLHLSNSTVTDEQPSGANASSNMTSTNPKSKHRLQQALTFSEENYQHAESGRVPPP